MIEEKARNSDRISEKRESDRIERNTNTRGFFFGGRGGGWLFFFSNFTMAYL